MGARQKKKIRPPAAAKTAAGIHWSRAVSGFILGMLAALGAMLLFGNPFIWAYWDYLPLPAGLIGSLLAFTRARVALWTAGGLICLGICVVGYTPLIVPAVHGLVRRDPLQPADVAVVLASDIRPDGEFDSTAQRRILHGYEVVRQGYAPRMVLTRLVAHPSYLPSACRQMRRLDIEVAVEETGRVANTHDEALAIARLVRKRGWDRVILVSDATHMRRAAAVFRKTGVRVLCSPCPCLEYDLERLPTPSDRLRAFRDWLHESIGYEVYRVRGWI